MIKHYEDFLKETDQGVTYQKALSNSFKKFEDMVQMRIDEAKTTEIIAKSMRVKPLMTVLQKDSFLEGYHKMLRLKRDVTIDEMKEEIQNIDDFTSSVIFTYYFYNF